MKPTINARSEQWIRKQLMMISGWGGSPGLIHLYDALRYPMSLNSWRRIAPPPDTTNKQLPLLQDPNVKKEKKLTNITPVLRERKNKTWKQINVARDEHKTRELATPRTSSSRRPLCYNPNLLNLGFQPLATSISTISVLSALMGGVCPGGQFPGSRRTKSFKSLT